MITATEANGRTYYQTTARGVDYSACNLGGVWIVSTHRRALGPRHFGGAKHFRTLAELCANVRAFRGLDVLAGATA